MGWLEIGFHLDNIRSNETFFFYRLHDRNWSLITYFRRVLLYTRCIL